ncbi:MAG: hypothetical protein LUQ38_02145 [Methanotrichaceae archaeon]|nr:hypothetical protein [Methanotrichaceae archaeon]MDD1757124.1 hypothetical protein [Methanotrichaceae archaeon]
MDDLTLLRKFEPVVCFTQGELFFPCVVDGYLSRCSLWIRDSLGKEQMLVAQGDLNAKKLAEFREVQPGHIIFLRFVEKPMNPLDYQAWRLRADKPTLKSGGRLARVSLFSRILDAFMDSSLLVRGMVPGGTTASAEVEYREIFAEDPRYVYYGRVIREGGYTALHYIFFYAMNDWRSTFHGINDHESDWEQAFIYLSSDAEGELQPLWVAYASHDFSGDDLRRRWDDPELNRVGTHPIYYAGAGSHSGYFLSGDYLMGVFPEFLQPVRKIVESIRNFWIWTLRQGEDKKDEMSASGQVTVPYIDYARGDGLSVGPGQNHEWSPILLTEHMGWAEHYRGLWGLDTRDRFGGERGPAGPKFNRDGSIRNSWYDPLGWAGLDKVPTFQKIPEMLQENIAKLVKESESLEVEIAEKQEKLRLMYLEVTSLGSTEYLEKLHKNQLKRLEKAQKEFKDLNARSVEISELIKAEQTVLEAVRKGDLGKPQAHIMHKRLPMIPIAEASKGMQFWSAISGGLLITAFVLSLIIAPSRWLEFLILSVFTLFAIEAAFKKRLPEYLLNITVVLAVIAGFVLIINFLFEIVMIILIGIVIYSVIGNLREVSGK